MTNRETEIDCTKNTQEWKKGLAKQKLGARLRYFIKFWEQIMKDRYVLNTIKGLKLEFYEDVIPNQNKLPHLIQMNEEEKRVHE